MNQTITLEDAIIYLNQLIDRVEAAEEHYGHSSERYKNRVLTLHTCTVMIQDLFKVKINADITDEYKATVIG